jgi:hypothetical protein
VLNQPYPTSERSLRSIFFTGLIAGTFVALFIIVFQPFGTNETSFPGKTLFLAGYGVILAVGVWIGGIFSARVFDAEKWTVGKQILLVLIASLLTITVSYFYVLQLGGSASWFNYRIFVGNAMMTASLPIVGITAADYFLKFRKYHEGARRFNVQEEKKPPLAKPKSPTSLLTDTAAEVIQEFIVMDDQERPILTLSTNHVWCLRSDRNYVDIFHLDANGGPTKTTVRNTLTKLTDGLPESFLHCHRSYVVNATEVTKVSGNAQGYRLHNTVFEDIPVPVSRGRSKRILNFVGQ